MGASSREGVPKNIDMKKYIKPCLEFIDLTTIGPIMDIEGGGTTKGSGMGSGTEPSGDDFNSAPRRRVF